MHQLISNALIVLGMAIFAPLFTILGALHTGFKSLLGERNLGSTAHAHNRAWARLIVWLSPVRMYRDGLENIPRDRPVIIVANHASVIDILVMLGYLPMDFRFVSKRILFKILWAMKISHYIPVDRDRTGRDWARVRRMGGELLENGVSVLLYPEGRRSRDGSLGEFRPGAFKLAIDEQVDILPVALYNTYPLMPPDVLFPRAGPVGLRVLEPISTQGLGRDDLEAIRDRAREEIGAAVQSLEADVLERERARKRFEWLPV